MIIIGTAASDGLPGTAEADQIYGLDGDDVMVGFEGDDFLDGGAGDDIARGGSGADTLLGGDGDDFQSGGSGDDFLDGGAGINRVTFRTQTPENDPGAMTAVHVSLLLQGQAQDTGHGFDTLVNIRHLSGTLFADGLTGDGQDNWLAGGGGNDTLDGLGGDDLLSANAGTLILRGGGGHDAVEFTDNGAGGPVTVSLEQQGHAQNTGQGTVTLTSIEDLSGSFDGDTLIGENGANTLAGDDGGDTLSGGNGSDALYGDGYITIDSAFGTSGPIALFPELPDGLGGEDVLDGGNGKDILAGGAGADTLTGGNGTDTYVWLDVSDSAPGASDFITELDKHDTIDLSAIDADLNAAGDQAFVLVSALTGAAGQAAMSYAAGVTSLMLDVDGDGVADAVIDLAGDQRGHSDFVL